MSIRTVIASGVALLFTSWAASAAAGTELLFVERPGCPYCVKWEREVAPAYAASDEGRELPLRRANLDHGQPAGLKAPVRFTPTFVVMKDGREIDRITGYMNDATFWGMLGKVMSRTSRETAAAKTN